MIIRNKDRSYTNHKKFITGKGFVDSLTSTLKNVGSYISQNKDLIARPLLGAAGNIAALGLTEGSKLLLSHIINKRLNNVNEKSNLKPKHQELIQNILSQSSEVPTTNIIGSGIKRF